MHQHSVIKVVFRGALKTFRIPGILDDYRSISTQIKIYFRVFRFTVDFRYISIYLNPRLTESLVLFNRFSGVGFNHHDGGHMNISRCVGLAVTLTATFVITAVFFHSSSGRAEGNAICAIEDTVQGFDYPYYRFVQVYDSVAISCWFGEAFIGRSDNTSKALVLSDWNCDNHSPLCMSTLDSLKLVSKTRSVLGGPGDTITYFKTIITDFAHGWMTGDFPPTDQIRFITELIDSTSGNVIAYMDTMGVRTFNDRYSADTAAFGNLESTHYYILPSFESTGFTYEKVFIRVRPVFDGNSNDEVICRWDVYVPEKMSIATDEFLTNLIQGMDSLYTAGFFEKKNQDAEPVYRFSSVISTRAGSDEVTLSLSSPLQDVIDVTVYNDLGQRVCYQRSIPIHVGTTNVRIELRNRPSGIYYVIGTDSREIVLIKRFSFLP
jgi:hypothetical protein